MLGRRARRFLLNSRAEDVCQVAIVKYNSLISTAKVPCSLDEIIEFSLFLPRRQAAALEAAAHCRGMTAAQLTRRLLLEFVNHLPPRVKTSTRQDFEID
jgi:hypothetical protein